MAKLSAAGVAARSALAPGTGPGPDDPLLPSPCVGVCVLDERTGWCVGCGRSGEELFGWGDLAPPRQRHVWRQVPARLAELRRPVRVLPWGGQALIARLALATQVVGARWSMRAGGRELVLATTGAGAVTVAGTDRGFIAATDGVRLLIDAVAGLRGFHVRRGERVDVLLGLHRSRLRAAAPAAPTDLGRDPAPLLAARPDARLVNLGIGGAGARACVRIDGERWPSSARALVEDLHAGAGAAVMLTGVGRMEAACFAAASAPAAEPPPDYVACASLLVPDAARPLLDLDGPD